MFENELSGQDFRMKEKSMLLKLNLKKIAVFNLINLRQAYLTQTSTVIVLSDCHQTSQFKIFIYFCINYFRFIF